MAGFGALAPYPALADLLGERHRIIANDWQSAGLQALVGRLLRRALEILDRIDLSPEAVRADLSGERTDAAYLYSASELIDRAADLLAGLPADPEEPRLGVVGGGREDRVAEEEADPLLGSGIRGVGIL